MAFSAVMEYNEPVANEYLLKRAALHRSIDHNLLPHHFLRKVDSDHT